MKDCVFCKIIDGSIKSNILYEDDMVISFLDANPDTVGHTLIIPKKHYKDLDDIDEKVLSHILVVAKDIKRKLYEKLDCDGITLIQNNGACQEIKHFHLHLKPYYKNNQNMIINDVYKKIMN